MAAKDYLERHSNIKSGLQMMGKKPSHADPFSQALLTLVGTNKEINETSITRQDITPRSSEGIILKPASTPIKRNSKQYYSLMS